MDKINCQRRHFSVLSTVFMIALCLPIYLLSSANGIEKYSNQLIYKRRLLKRMELPFSSPKLIRQPTDKVVFWLSVKEN